MTRRSPELGGGLQQLRVAILDQVSQRRSPNSERSSSIRLRSVVLPERGFDSKFLVSIGGRSQSLRPLERCRRRNSFLNANDHAEILPRRPWSCRVRLKREGIVPQAGAWSSARVPLAHLHHPNE
jgi:hypothetical protein